MIEHDRISITADAMTLPEFVEASIEGLEAGSHVTAADVMLPAGAELAADAGARGRRRVARAERRAARGRGCGEVVAAAPEAVEEAEAAEGETADAEPPRPSRSRADLT